MTTLSISTGGLSLTNFTAYELPTKKWMRLIRPKMRLRVRMQNHDFVSSSVKVDDQSLDGANFALGVQDVHWPWREDDRFPRPSFADHETFEVEVERRFLLGYKCIRRTKRVTMDEVPGTNDHGELWLYDGQLSAEMLEDRIEIGRVTFTLRSDASSDASSQNTFSTSAYSEKVGPQRRRGTLWRTCSSLFQRGRKTSESDSQV